MLYYRRLVSWIEYIVCHLLYTQIFFFLSFMCCALCSPIYVVYHSSCHAYYFLTPNNCTSCSSRFTFHSLFVIHLVLPTITRKMQVPSNNSAPRSQKYLINYIIQESVTQKVFTACQECGHKHRENVYCHCFTEADDEDDPDDGINIYSCNLKRFFKHNKFWHHSHFRD